MPPYAPPDREIAIIYHNTNIDGGGEGAWYNGDSDGFLKNLFSGTLYAGYREGGTGPFSFVPNASTAATALTTSAMETQLSRNWFLNQFRGQLILQLHLARKAAPYTTGATADSQVWNGSKIANARGIVRKLADRFPNATGSRGIKIWLGTNEGDLERKEVVYPDTNASNATAIARFVQLDKARWQELHGPDAPFKHPGILGSTTTSAQALLGGTGTYKVGEYLGYNNGEVLDYIDAHCTTNHHKNMGPEDGTAGMWGAEPPTGVQTFYRIWKAIDAARTAYGPNAPRIPILATEWGNGLKAANYIGTLSGEWATDDNTQNGKHILRTYRMGLALNALFYWGVTAASFYSIAFSPAELGTGANELEKSRGTNGTQNLYYVSATNTLSGHQPEANVAARIWDMRRYILPIDGRLTIPTKTWQYTSTNLDNGFHVPYTWAVTATAYNQPDGSSLSTAPWSQWREVTFPGGGEIVSAAGGKKVICRPVFLPRHTDWTVEAEIKVSGGGTAQLCVRGYDLLNGLAFVRSSNATATYSTIKVTFRPKGHALDLPNAARALVCLYHNGTGEARMRNVSIYPAGSSSPIAEPLAVTVSATPTSGNVPLAVTFSSTATGGTGPYTYAWTFGDTGTSAVQNPSHTYSTAGAYTARCTVTDSTSATASATVSISATNASSTLVATATASPASGDAPLSVTFGGSATGGTSPYTYAWAFGDGGDSLPFRARPRVINHSLHTDTGKLLRGCTMDIRTQATPPCTQQSVWDGYRALGLNVVRLDVKTDANGAGRPLAQQLPFLDAAVECASRARMYVMVLVGITPGSYDLAQLTEFWTAVAPRYKDRPHVFYEITNEPVSGGGYWGQTSHWTAPKLADLRGVFDIMRAGAPDTHICMFSTPNIYPNAASWLTVPAQFSAAAATPVDWSNVSISFHHYLGTYASGDPDGFGCLKAMQDAGYNLFMSECNDFMGDGPSVDPRNSQQVWAWLSTGHGGVSAPVAWCNLDGKAGNVNTQITNKIIPYLQAQGCPLVVEGAIGSAAQNPTHNYTAAGTYTATLTVTDAVSATDADTKTITVTTASGDSCLSSTSDLFLNPCSAATAMKRPIGSNATYGGSTHTMTLSWLRSGNAAGMLALNATTSGWGAGFWDCSSTTGTVSVTVRARTDASASTKSRLPITIRVPNGFNASDYGPEGRDNTALLYDGTNFRDFWKIRAVTENSVYEVGAFPGAHAAGGQGHGGNPRSTSASGLWHEGMTIRGHEWNNASTGKCEHMLGIGLGSKSTHAVGPQIGPSFVWPATSGDNSMAQNTGTIPYGTIFAIPSPAKGGPDPSTLSLGADTSLKARLYWQMRNYGWVVCDQSNNPSLRCDQTLTEANRSALQTAARALYPYMRPITNVGTSGSNPIGGGTPVAPNCAFNRGGAPSIQPVSWWAAKWGDGSVDLAAGLPLSTGKGNPKDGWTLYDLAPWIDGNCMLYRATGDTKYLERNLLYIENCISRASVSNATNFPESTYKDGYRGWINMSNPIRVDNDEQQLHEYYMWRYVMQTLYHARNETAYETRLAAILAFTEQHMWTKWYTRGSSQNRLYRETIYMTSHAAVVALYLRVMATSATVRSQCQTLLDNMDSVGMPIYIKDGVRPSFRRQMLVHPMDPEAYIYKGFWPYFNQSEPYYCDQGHGDAFLTYVIAAMDMGYGDWGLADIQKFLKMAAQYWPSAGVFYYWLLGATGESGRRNGGTYNDGTLKLGGFNADFQRRVETHTSTINGSQFQGCGALNAARLLGTVAR